MEGGMHALDAATVRRICSGQVVVDLCAIVNELVANAIDADARSVEVILDQGGLGAITVRDDGGGVPAAARAVFGQRHYTSKLEAFEDLGKVRSLGFRGEGLSSVCEACVVTVTTRTASDQLGVQLALGHDGTVTGAPVQQSRQVGTAVRAAKPFARHPVRLGIQKAQRKAQAKKIYDLVVEYALAYPGIRFLLRNSPQRDFVRSRAVDTAAAVSAIFGAPLARQLARRRHRNDEHGFSFLLMVPKAGADADTVQRASSERTFVAINQRPIDFPAAERVAYAQYRLATGAGSRKFPFFLLQIDLPTDLYDVNVVPNKRTLIVDDLVQRALLDDLEREVAAVYAGDDGNGTGSGAVGAGGSAPAATTLFGSDGSRSTPRAARPSSEPALASLAEHHRRQPPQPPPRVDELALGSTEEPTQVPMDPAAGGTLPTPPPTMPPLQSEEARVLLERHDQPSLPLPSQQEQQPSQGAAPKKRSRLSLAAAPDPNLSIKDLLALKRSEKASTEPGSESVVERDPTPTTMEVVEAAGRDPAPVVVRAMERPTAEHNPAVQPIAAMEVVEAVGRDPAPVVVTAMERNPAPTAEHNPAVQPIANLVRPAPMSSTAAPQEPAQRKRRAAPLPAQDDDDDDSDDHDAARASPAKRKRATRAKTPQRTINQVLRSTNDAAAPTGKRSRAAPTLESVQPRFDASPRKRTEPVGGFTWEWTVEQCRRRFAAAPRGHVRLAVPAARTKEGVPRLGDTFEAEAFERAKMEKLRFLGLHNASGWALFADGMELFLFNGVLAHQRLLRRKLLEREAVPSRPVDMPLVFTAQSAARPETWSALSDPGNWQLFALNGFVLERNGASGDSVRAVALPRETIGLDALWEIAELIAEHGPRPAATRPAAVVEHLAHQAAAETTRARSEIDGDPRGVLRRWLDSGAQGKVMVRLCSVPLVQTTP